MTLHIEGEHEDVGEGGDGKHGDQQVEEVPQEVSQFPQHFEWNTAASIFLKTIRTFWNFNGFNFLAVDFLVVHAEEDNKNAEER